MGGSPLWTAHYLQGIPQEGLEIGRFLLGPLTLHAVELSGYAVEHTVDECH
jgi:hypothetical protein